MDVFDTYLEKLEEVGFAEKVLHSIVYVKGIPGAKINEVVVFESGETGYVLSLDGDFVEVVLLSRSQVKVGTRVARTDRVIQVVVGDELLGKVVDPLGNVVSKMVPDQGTKRKPDDVKLESRKIDVSPPGMRMRRNINKPFETGVTLVDLVVPLGVGQRELIVGDRKTGKTQFLLQVMHTQALRGTVCIYTTIAKKKLDIKLIEDFVKEKNISRNVLIVATKSDDPAGLVFLTPYSAMTMAEYFRDRGENVLIILDDMSAHAKYYREITLLARRFPGRSSYPGDIFYVHSRLLERAGNFAVRIKTNEGKVEEKEAAITCLPVAELVLSDFSGYIQTNLMAMTDGHIFFDSDIFNQGKRPAINTFLSVTRVGRQAQSMLLRDLNRQLTKFLVAISKLRDFMHFGAELSEATKRVLSLGDKLYAFFDQKSLSVVPLNLNVVIISALWGGYWRDSSINKLKSDIDILVEYYKRDEKFRQKVNDAVSAHKDFASLVEAMKLNGDDLFFMLKKEF